MQRKEIEKVYIKKINELKRHNKAYFGDDNPIISDKDYDYLKQEVLLLEKKYNYLKSEYSPSKIVGYKPLGKFNKVNHSVPMLSLSNAFSQDDVLDFFKKIRNFYFSFFLVTMSYATVFINCTFFFTNNENKSMRTPGFLGDARVNDARVNQFD